MSVAVVTGAARGIGAATAELLASHQFAVAVLDVNVKGALEVAERIRARGGNALGLECDVSKAASVEVALRETTSRLGEPSVLVNNAGIGGPFHRVDQVSEQEWDELVAINLKSVFLFSRLLLPKMKERGFGRIINMASIQGLVGAPLSSTYVAAKHGIIGYTRAIAAEWGAHGITCNAICPGYVDTAMGVQDAGSGHAEFLRKVLARTPVGRIAQPREIAALVAYLAGPDSGYVNGAAFVIDGGIMADVGVT